MLSHWFLHSYAPLVQRIQTKSRISKKQYSPATLNNLHSLEQGLQLMITSAQHNYIQSLIATFNKKNLTHFSPI